MELNQTEFSRVSEATTVPAPAVELSELQLAFVGGGIGETVL